MDDRIIGLESRRFDVDEIRPVFCIPADQLQGIETLRLSADQMAAAFAAAESLLRGGAGPRPVPGTDPASEGPEGDPAGLDPS